jgi:hypothetical protein
MKSTDSEKGLSERGTISRPTYDWKPQPTLPPDIQGPVTKTALPARSPGTTLQGHVCSLAKSLFRPHKKTGSTTSTTHLLIPAPPSRSHSPTSHLERSGSSSSSLLVGRPIAPASVLDAELAVPPEAIQKSIPPVPRLNHLTIELPPQHDLYSTGLSPPPRGKRSRISRDLWQTSGSPTVPIAPFLEVTLYSPTASPTDGVSSLINMYISRYPTTSAELPPFPDTAVHRDSSVSLPVSPTTRLPAASAVDIPVTVPPEDVGYPLKAAVSIGAVGGRPTPFHPPGLRPELPPHTTLPQYSDFEFDAPPSSEVRVDRETNARAQSRSAREGQASVRGRPTLRALPLPPSRPALSSTQGVHLHKSSSSSSRYGYL